jgi:hypothetical protein
MSTSIEESLRRHYAAGPLRYDPVTRQPLDEGGRLKAAAVHEAMAMAIRSGLIEVVGERDGKLVYGSLVYRGPDPCEDVARYDPLRRPQGQAAWQALHTVCPETGLEQGARDLIGVLSHELTLGGAAALLDELREKPENER